MREAGHSVLRTHAQLLALAILKVAFGGFCDFTEETVRCERLMIFTNKIKRRFPVSEGFKHHLILGGRRRSVGEGGRYERIGNSWQQDYRSQRHEQIGQHLQNEPGCQLKHGRPPK